MCWLPFLARGKGRDAHVLLVCLAEPRGGQQKGWLLKKERCADYPRLSCRAKKGPANKLQAPPVTFWDVAGLDTAKEYEKSLIVLSCLAGRRRGRRTSCRRRR